MDVENMNEIPDEYILKKIEALRYTCSEINLKKKDVLLQLTITLNKIYEDGFQDGYDKRNREIINRKGVSND